MSLKHDSFKKLRKERNKWKVDTPEEYDERERVFLREMMLHKDPTISTYVRITAGKVKNFKLEIPRTPRPLTDRMKVRIFDILKQDIINKKILDLYAGGGTFGLEALSRGAGFVTFVEASRNAIISIKSNIEKTGFTSQTELIKSKTEEYLYKQVNKEKKEPFDIIFLDPPYKLFNTKKTHNMENIINLASSLLPGVQDRNMRKWKGALILKHPRKYDLEKLNIQNIELVENFYFGLNVISFFIVK